MNEQEKSSNMTKVATALKTTGLETLVSAHAMFDMVSMSFAKRIAQETPDDQIQVEEAKIERVHDAVAEVLNNAGTHIGEDIMILSSLLADALENMIDRQRGGASGNNLQK